MNDAAVRQIVRDKIVDGRLPRDRATCLAIRRAERNGLTAVRAGLD